MKRNILIISIVIVIFIVISIAILYFGVLFKNVYRLDETIFDITKITNITIKDNGKGFVIGTNENMKELLNIIKGNDRSTRKQSVNDAPNVEKIIHIDVNYSDNSYKRIYVYNYGINYYLELPYEGVYKLSKNDYTLIKSFLK